jgi:AcrR family transcriptional regulator
MVDQPQTTPPLSLTEEQGRLTRSRIRQAAMKVVARRGFDATVEEIARESGVSPRTIFRHYATQGRLILATVKDMFEAVGSRPIPGLPAITDDLDGWLEGLAVTVHTRNAEIIGNAFWDLHAPDHDGSEVLDAVAALRRDSRCRGVHYLATLAWKTAGGHGDTPAELESAFALNFSTFATQALMIDFDQTPAGIGELTADLLKIALARALRAQQVAPGPEAGEPELGPR